MSRDAVIGHI